MASITRIPLYINTWALLLLLISTGGEIILNRDSRLLNCRRRVARTLLIIAIVFAVCWMPYNLTQLFLDTLEKEQLKEMDKTAPHLLMVSDTEYRNKRTKKIEFLIEMVCCCLLYYRCTLSVYGWVMLIPQSIRCSIASFRATSASQLRISSARPAGIFATVRSPWKCCDAEVPSVKSKIKRLICIHDHLYSELHGTFAVPSIALIVCVN